MEKVIIVANNVTSSTEAVMRYVHHFASCPKYLNILATNILAVSVRLIAPSAGAIFPVYCSPLYFLSYRSTDSSTQALRYERHGGNMTPILLLRSFSIA